MTIPESEGAEVRLFEGLDQNRSAHGKRGISARSEKVQNVVSGTGRFRWTPLTPDKNYAVNVSSLRKFLLRNARVAFPGISKEDAIKTVKKLSTKEMVQTLQSMNSSARKQVRDLFYGIGVKKEGARYFLREMLHFSEDDTKQILHALRASQDPVTGIISSNNFLDCLIDNKEIFEKYKSEGGLALACTLYINSPNDRSARLSFATELSQATQNEIRVGYLPFSAAPLAQEDEQIKNLWFRRLLLPPSKQAMYTTKEKWKDYYIKIANRTEKERTGQERTGQERTGQERTGQNRTETAPPSFHKTIASEPDFEGFIAMLQTLSIPQETRRKLFENLDIPSQILVLSKLTPAEQTFYRDSLHDAIAHEPNPQKKESALNIIASSRLFELQSPEVREQLSSGNSTVKPKPDSKKPQQ